MKNCDICSGSIRGPAVTETTAAFQSYTTLIIHEKLEKGQSVNITNSQNNYKKRPNYRPTGVLNKIINWKETTYEHTQRLGETVPLSAGKIYFSVSLTAALIETRRFFRLLIRTRCCEGNLFFLKQRVHTPALSVYLRREGVASGHQTAPLQS